MGVSYRDQRQSDQALIVSLENSLRLHEHSHRFHRSLVGRFLSPILGLTDPRLIEIDGKRLKHLFELTGEPQADEISISHMYIIGVATLGGMIKRLPDAAPKR